MYRRALTLLRSEDEARDAMQETFARVVEQHSRFSGDVPVLHWLYRITTNLCLNRIRHRKAHPVVSDPQAVLTLVDGGTANHVERATVVALLSKHDMLTQQIAVHYYIDEMSMEEVAQMVGRSRKTVGKKLERFRKRSQAMLS